MTLDIISNFGQIIIADLVLSGDNALVIGMAASNVPAHLRQRVIFLGMVLAIILRIIFAIVATSLLEIKGLLFIGAIVLFVVCWQLYKEIRTGNTQKHSNTYKTVENANNMDKTSHNAVSKALISITIADFSMSLDNVLAVAAIADGDNFVLIFGLALAIILMVFAATFIAKILTKYPWISWLGLFVLCYVAGDMLYRGIFDSAIGIGPMLELTEGIEFKKVH